MHTKLKGVITLQTIKTNVIGTLNMLGLAKRVGARLEFFSNDNLKPQLLVGLN